MKRRKPINRHLAVAPPSLESVAQEAYRQGYQQGLIDARRQAQKPKPGGLVTI